MNNAFDDAVATGKVTRAPERVVAPKDEPRGIPDAEKVYGLDAPHEFELAVARAKFNPGAFLYVDDALMKYLMRGAEDKSLVYHGVRLYIKDAKAELDKQERMSAETLHSYLGNKKQDG